MRHKWLNVCVVLALWCTCYPTFSHSGDAQTALPHALDLAEVEQYLLQYRITGNEALLVAVEPFFVNAVNPPPNADAQRWHMLFAWHAQAQHRFSIASDQVSKLLSLGSRDLRIWLLQANLLRIQGATQGASVACQQVLARHVLLGKLCSATVALDSFSSLVDLGLTTANADDPAAAEANRRLRQIERLAQLPNSLPEDSALQAWMLSRMADLYAATGEFKIAIAIANQSREIESSAQRTALLADLLLRSNQPRKALEVIETGPQTPALVVARLMALTELERLAGEADVIASLDSEFRQNIERGDFLHAREMARFYLDILPQPKLATTLALKNWQTQREREDRVLLIRTAAL